MRILLDASVYAPLVILAGSRVLSASSRFAILDLTVYEACNAYWKEATKLRRMSIGDALDACLAAYRLSRRLVVLSLDEALVEEAERLALEEGITFYDASYVAAAEMLGYAVATEDGDILRVAPRRGVEVLRFSDVLGVLDRV